MASVEFDDSELRRFAADLGRATPALAKDVQATVFKAAMNIKATLQSEASGHARFPQFPRSITFDTKVSADGFETEIGPDKDRPQGALGNLLYFGTSTTSGVLPDPGLALEREVPALEAYLADALERAFLT